jgi:hypothetical protein
MGRQLYKDVLGPYSTDPEPKLGKQKPTPPPKTTVKPAAPKKPPPK